MDREEILSKITEWSTQMGLIVKSIEDPTADFHITVSEPNLPPVDVVHPRADSAYVLIASSVLVSEEDQKKMMNMKIKELEKLHWKIKLELLSMNVEFRTLIRTGGIPNAWEIHLRLFLEGAIPQHFSDLYLKVKNAVFFVIWSYRSALGILKSGA